MCRSNGVCSCLVRSRLRARLHSLMCTVGVQVSVRLDVLLILCQAKTSFKKSVQRAPYGALMLESAVKRERDGGKENEGREGWIEGETERRVLFFGFSASVIKLSHVKDRWNWCSCKCRLM